MEPSAHQPSQEEAQQPARQVAVVTGGLGSIGRAVADALHARGITPLVLDVRERAADAVLPPGTRCAQVDCRDSEAVGAALHALVGGTDRLVAAFHCAGGGHLGEQSSADPALPAQADMEDAVANNLFSAFALVGTVVPLLRAGGGAVVFTSSVNAYGGWGSPAYSAAKAGLLGYARSLAVLLAPDGIRVNCVTPGSVDTDGFRTLLEQQGRPEVLDQLARHAPLGKVTTPDEVAHAMVAVAFDLPSMTGQDLVVDNGQTLRRY